MNNQDPDEVLMPDDDPGLDYLGRTQGFAMLARVVSVLDAAVSLAPPSEVARYQEARNLLAGRRFDSIAEARLRRAKEKAG